MLRPAVLVVDDDRGNCAIVARRLTQEGYEVDVAYNGLDALAMVQEKPYRLGVLDYQMPGMDGVELYQRITEVRPGMIGVFLTSYASINTVFSAVGVGVQRVLSKPVDFRELVPLVEELIGKAASTNGAANN